MAFEERQFPLSEALVARERMANGDILHMLGMFSTESAENLTLFQVEAHKMPGQASYHGFTWHTTIEEAGSAAEVLDNAVRTADLVPRTVIVMHDEGTDTYDVTAEQTDEIQEISELDLATTGLLRMEASTATIVWHKPDIVSPDFRMGIVTCDDIQSPWIQDILGQTSSEAVQSAVSSNLEPIATLLHEFYALPFGEPLPINPDV